MEFETVILKLNTPTKNGRVYTTEAITEALERSPKQLMGMIGADSDMSTNLSRVSHMVTNIHVDGDELKGTVSILDTPQGEMLRNILEANGTDKFRVASIAALEPADGYVKPVDITFVRCDYLENPS